LPLRIVENTFYWKIIGTYLKTKFRGQEEFGSEVSKMKL
jgi:hypothetical protein